MAEYPSDLDLNKLKKELHLSDSAIAASEFTETDLQAIYTDYLKRLPSLNELKNLFISKYIVSADNLQLHSFSARTKDPYHLIEKIIRKRSTNDLKYKSMTTSDYYKYITDLIGCRILLVYKEDWKNVHDYLVSVFPDNPESYIDKEHYVASYDTAPSSPFMAEQPVVHMRPGDPEIYPCDMKIKRDKYYRSLHYIVRYKDYYIEIQVRTLFDEAWGEVDHDVLYPYFKDNQDLIGFSMLINRIAGAGDEMSSYFKSQLLKLLPPPAPDNNKVPLDVPIITTAPQSQPSSPLLTPHNFSTGKTPKLDEESSGEDLLHSILFSEKRNSHDQSEEKPS